jgi:hypothetical protein
MGSVVPASEAKGNGQGDPLKLRGSSSEIMRCMEFSRCVSEDRASSLSGGGGFDFSHSACGALPRS